MSSRVIPPQRREAFRDAAAIRYDLLHHFRLE
jgi:hypothetical protein